MQDKKIGSHAITHESLDALIFVLLLYTDTYTDNAALVKPDYLTSVKLKGFNL